MPSGGIEILSRGIERPSDGIQMSDPDSRHRARMSYIGASNACVYPECVVLPNIYDLPDDPGKLKDAELLGRLRKQAECFVEFVEKLKGVKLRAAK